MLTTEQIAHFETFGFVIRQQCFSATEMAEISRAFDDVLAEDRKGRPFDGKARQGVLGFIEKRPLLSGLVEDDRIFEPLEQLLGPGFVWIGSDGNLYVGDTGWHPDGSVLDYGRIKVALYLDPVMKDTGCLRVIPVRTGCRCTTRSTRSSNSAAIRTKWRLTRTAATSQVFR